MTTSPDMSHTLTMYVKDEIAVTSMKWILMTNISKYLLLGISLLASITWK